MNVKDYLLQAYRLDQRINSKIEQISVLNELATKATAALNNMPSGRSRNIHRSEDLIMKILDLENEIKKDMEELVERKTNIVHLIKKVDNPDYQLILESRYLSYETWDQITMDLGYSIQHTYRLHDNALKNIQLLYNQEMQSKRSETGKSIGLPAS